MTLAIRVVPAKGKFTATVVGDPDLHATRLTREEAVQALQQEIQNMASRGELVSCEIEPPGLISLFGKYRDDPMLKEICRQAYAARDAEKAKPSRARKTKKQRSK